MNEADQIRKAMIETGQPAADLAADADRRWTTDEMTAEFEVIGFAAPFVVARRRSDGQKGSLEFTHSPRTYFGWKPDTPHQGWREQPEIPRFGADEVDHG